MPLGLEEMVHGGYLHQAREGLSVRMQAEQPSLQDSLLAAIYFRKSGDQIQALRALALHQDSPAFDVTHNQIQSLCHLYRFAEVQSTAEQALQGLAIHWIDQQCRYLTEVAHVAAALAAAGAFPTTLLPELLEGNLYHNLDSGEHTCCPGFIDRNRRLGGSVEALFDPESQCWLDRSNGKVIGELLQPNQDFCGFVDQAAPWKVVAGSHRLDPHDTICGPAVFVAGTSSFGQFMTQSASYANALGYAQHFASRSDREITVLSKDRIPSWGQELLQRSCQTPLLFRVFDPHQRLAAKQLVVAPPTWIESHYIHQDHRRLFHQAAWAEGLVEARARRKIYFSCSRVKQLQASSMDEGELEAALTARGFEIVHPQELPLAELIHLVNQASVIAGAVGSTMHHVLFRLPGLPLTTLNFAPSLPVADTALLERCIGIDQNIYLRSTEEVEGASGEPDRLHFNLSRCLEGVDAALGL